MSRHHHFGRSLVLESTSVIARWSYHLMRKLSVICGLVDAEKESQPESEIVDSQIAYNQNQKSSCINDEVGEVFEVIVDLKYSAFSIRAAEVLGPTVTAIPASRRAATPRPSTRGFGSVMQHTTLFTRASIKASVHGGVRLPSPR